MGKLTTAQQEWLEALGVKEFGSNGAPAAKATGLAAGLEAVDLKSDAKAEAFESMSEHVSADSDMPDESQGKVHPKLVEMTPPPGVTLPTLKQPVVLVSESGKPQEMSRSEITKRPDYVDNFTKATLYVPTIWDMKNATKLKLNLFYSSGAPVGLPWPLILFQWEQPAYKYGYQFGKIIPQAADGNALLDKNNTPSIIVAALLFKDELDKLAEQYEQIADLVYTVGGAIASSASHLNSIPNGSFGGGNKSKSKGPARGGPKGGNKQTRSGGKAGGSSGSKPVGRGGTGGKPAVASEDGLPPASMKLDESPKGKKGSQGGGGSGASFKGDGKGTGKPGGKKGGSGNKGGKGETDRQVVGNKQDGDANKEGGKGTGKPGGKKGGGPKGGGGGDSPRGGNEEDGSKGGKKGGGPKDGQAGDGPKGGKKDAGPKGGNKGDGPKGGKRGGGPKGGQESDPKGGKGSKGSPAGGKPPTPPAAPAKTERVGRWMSQKEYADMVRTGKVQERAGNHTNVVSPPNPDSYKGAPPGWKYVEFDVPASSLREKSAGQKLIPGPNHNYGKLAVKQGLPPLEMPTVTNIKVVIEK